MCRRSRGSCCRRRCAAKARGWSTRRRALHGRATIRPAISRRAIASRARSCASAKRTGAPCICRCAPRSGVRARAVSDDRGRRAGAGLDLARDRIPGRPAAHYVMGGVETDLDGRTSIPGCSRPARSPAPASTARTGSPATRCSKGSCSARAPARDADDARRGRCRSRDEDPGSTRPGRSRTMRRSSRPRASDVRGLMWRDVGLFRDRPALAPRELDPPAWRDAAMARASDGRSRRWRGRQLVTVGRADRARRAAPRGEPRRPLPRGLPARDDIHWKRVASSATGCDRTLIDPKQAQSMMKDRRKDDRRPTSVRHRDHAAVRGLLPLVSRRRPARRAGRLLAGQGLHGHPAVRLRHLGADPAGARRALQGHRPRQRLLPAVHSREPPDEGEGARRGVRAAGRLGDARAATRSSTSRSSSGRRRKRSSARCTRSGSSRGATCRC